MLPGVSEVALSAWHRHGFVSVLSLSILLPNLPLMHTMPLFLYSKHSRFPNISRERDSGRCNVVRGEVKTEVVFCSITVFYLPISVLCSHTVKGLY